MPTGLCWERFSGTVFVLWLRSEVKSTEHQHQVDGGESREADPSGVRRVFVCLAFSRVRSLLAAIAGRKLGLSILLHDRDTEKDHEPKVIGPSGGVKR